VNEPADPDDHKLECALFPYEVERTRELLASGRKLAHYTDAHVAHSIISNAEIWMRNMRVMNDFSEVQHGRECVDYAANQGLVGQLFEVVDAAHPGLSQEIIKLYDGWSNSLIFDTYLTCLSEFAAPLLRDRTPDPDHRYGRLSMWRAYGGENGVALIVDPAFLTEGGDLGNVFTSPVFYGDRAAFATQFARVVAGMRAIPDTLKSCDRAALCESVFNALRFGVLSAKHPAFKEEKEWRVIYSPGIGESPYINRTVKTVRGVPQVVHALQLRDDAENGVRLAPAELFEAVLIGPTDHEVTLRQTFVQAFADLNVPNPAARVRSSGIPLRK
jgi:hypothetical protein